MRMLAALASGATVYLAVGYLNGTGPPVPYNRTAPRTPSNRRLWLTQAGSDLSPVQFAAGSLAIGIVVFLVALVLSSAWWLAVIPALGAALFPGAYYARRRNDRLRKLREAWPDCLRDIGAAISSGATLVNALVSQADAGPQPLRTAFARFGLMSRMMGVVPALEVIKEELGDPTSDRVIEVVILAYQHGGELIGEVLRDLTDEIVEDLRLEAEVRTDGAEQRMESRVVLIIPWAMLLYVSFTSEQYRLFYRSSGGFVVVLFGAVWSFMGWLMIRRLSRPANEARVLVGSVIADQVGQT